MASSPEQLAEVERKKKIIREYTDRYPGESHSSIYLRILQDHPNFGGRSRTTELIAEAKKNAPLPPKDEKADTIDNDILLHLKKTRLAIHPREISSLLDRSEETVIAAIARLQDRGHNIQFQDANVILSSNIQPGAAMPSVLHLDVDYNRKWYKFGACGDNHLGSKHERIDVLNCLYDRYAEEGITTVYNTGNWIEGEKGKLNFHDIKVFGLDNQVDYWIENYPQRKGITTYFIAGDDHEGWYQQREALEIGKYAMLRARAAGRTDLVYLGYMEADVVLKAKNGERIMKVLHPGGGSAYAISYSMQKWTEALQGGEKPAVILAGHYHKFDYNYYREVHIVQTACTVDQSLFMRKNKLQAHVGGCIVSLMQADDGRITRFQVEYMPFYDRGFYEKMSVQTQ